jgi:hypothetical protein
MIKSSGKTTIVMLLMCALFFLIESVYVEAATYYVAMTGNDSGPGTISQPFRTVARGVNSLSAGDTLYIRSGTWTEQINVSSKSGSPGNYITIAAYPGDVVRFATSAYPFSITGTNSSSTAYLVFEGLILDGVNSGNQLYWTIHNGSHDIILRNLEIKNWKGIGLQIKADNIQVINCKIHDQISLSGAVGERWYGIYFASGANGLLEGNEIYNNPGGGIQIYPGPITNLAVRRNSLHDNNSLASSQIGGIIVAQDNGATIKGVEISNNLVYLNGSAPTHGPSPGIQIHWGASGVKVWNNTVYGNQGYGIDVAHVSSATNVIQNNIVYGNLYSGISDLGTGTIKDHNLTSNPGFQNISVLNFSLQTTSPAIDAGASLSQVTMDFKRNRRPQGVTHDIGAYEGGAGADSTSPVAPSNLRVH